ncbi:MAG: enoyl-CoA hydratase/isomerase family protein [Leptospirales bacterium]|nr:enoyl-CoA hydratase/isomerase family protein [Leptospirales bacterium]
MTSYPFFEIELGTAPGVATVWLNRPQARNAMSWDFWRDLPALVEELNARSELSAVALLARGKSFSTGLDIPEFFERFETTISSPEADGREGLLALIRTMQKGLNAIAASPKIWVAGVHRHCIGGGLDLIAACDLRLCSADASFSLREARVAIVADMGSLNRLPGIIGMSNTRLMALTAADFSAVEAQRMQLVSQVYTTQAEMQAATLQLAAQIAANPAIAVRGTKQALNFIQEHGIADSIDYLAVWNAGMLDSKALREMVAAMRARKGPA